MLRSWMVGALGGFLIVSAAWARPGIVKTTDGQTFDGDVVEKEDQIVVEHRGIHTTIDRDRVRSVSYSDSVEQEYRRRHGRLAQYDVPGRLELAHWLFENKSYDLARQVLEEAGRIQPHNTDVADLFQTVQRQEDLEAREARRHAPVELAAADNNPRAGAQPPARNPKAPAQTRVLTPEEINFIKQAEWQEGQQIKNIRFENDVRRRYVAREGLNPAQFNREPPYKQAWAIIHHGTEDMKKDVVIVGDPPAFAQFKKVQQQVLATCANCHNPRDAAGGFALRWPATSDADTYTNFLIFQRYQHKEGDKTWQMVNRERPEDSLLVQFALPPDLADAPHPKVGNYKGVVRMKNDVRYRTLLDWISSLNPVVPDYSDIDLSAQKSTSRPGGAPPGRGT